LVCAGSNDDLKASASNDAQANVQHDKGGHITLRKEKDASAKFIGNRRNLLVSLS
jgi:hypothetical protein